MWPKTKSGGCQPTAVRQNAVVDGLCDSRYVIVYLQNLLDAVSENELRPLIAAVGYLEACHSKRGGLRV
jgi:hypothetical protein